MDTPGASQNSSSQQRAALALGHSFLGRMLGRMMRGVETHQTSSSRFLLCRFGPLVCEHCHTSCSSNTSSQIILILDFSLIVPLKNPVPLKPVLCEKRGSLLLNVRRLPRVLSMMPTHDGVPFWSGRHTAPLSESLSTGHEGLRTRRRNARRVITPAVPLRLTRSVHATSSPHTPEHGASRETSP